MSSSAWPTTRKILSEQPVTESPHWHGSSTSMQWASGARATQGEHRGGGGKATAAGAGPTPPLSLPLLTPLLLLTAALSSEPDTALDRPVVTASMGHTGSATPSLLYRARRLKPCVPRRTAPHRTATLRTKPSRTTGSKSPGASSSARSRRQLSGVPPWRVADRTGAGCASRPPATQAAEAHPATPKLSAGAMVPHSWGACGG